MIRHFLLGFAAISQLLSSGAEYDWIIRNGRIVDGAGTAAFHADVAIQKNRVVKISRRIEASGEHELDASGFFIAPGFIDVHSHAENIEQLPLAESYARMGVASIVAGNCGSSTRDIGAFFDRISEQGVSINVASLIGHGTVRGSIMGGSFRRPPTTEDIDQMRGMVRDAMEDGAVGLSTGLIYLPGVFAETSEIIALAQEVSRYGGIYASHMRDEGLQIFSALDELFEIAEVANLPAHISHIKLSSQAAWGQANELIAAIEEARRRGLDITQDQYLYTASSTGISQLIPEEAREGGRDAFKERIADPAVKAAIVQQMKDKVRRRGVEDYAYAVIADYSHNPALNGMNIREAANKTLNDDSLDAQIEMILSIQSHGGASGVFHGIGEEDLQILCQHPNTMFAADSSVRAFMEGVPHPRGYGNNARALARYVRDLKVLRLEEAIRKMTSLPATTFQLKDRGLIREGAFADLVLFKLEDVQDKATFTEPHQYAEGIDYVFVNGTPVVWEGAHTKARPGMALRHAR